MKLPLPIRWFRRLLLWFNRPPTIRRYRLAAVGVEWGICRALRRRVVLRLRQQEPEAGG